MGSFACSAMEMSRGLLIGAELPPSLLTSQGSKGNDTPLEKGTPEDSANSLEELAIKQWRALQAA